MNVATTMITINDEELFTFGEITRGTIFTAKDLSGIYIKTVRLQECTASSSLDVNAIKMNDGTGACISSDTKVNIFTKVSCKR